MRNSWPFGRHRRWRDDVDAFVDGELSDERARRFEVHFATCGACALLVTKRTEAKLLTMALPEMPVPRSFRLTPGVLVSPVPARPLRTPVVMRLAQVTASIAVVAFAAVVVADLSSGGDAENTSLQTASDDDAAPASAGGAPVPGTTERNSAGAEDTSSSPTAAVPDVDSSVGAAANPPATPQPTTADQAYSGPPTTPGGTDEGSKSLTTGEGAGAPAAIGDAAVIDDDDDGRGRSFLAAEIGLAALATVAVFAWLALRRGSRI